MAHRLSDIAAALGVDPLGAADLSVNRLAEPASAGPGDLALAMTPKFAADLSQTKAVAAVVWPGCDWASYGLKAAIPVPRARLAMAHLTQAMDSPRSFEGVHASAIIAPDAAVADGCHIGPFTVIGAGATIGAGSWIDAHVTIAPGAQVGAGAVIHSGVRIGQGVRIGARAILQPNVVIGGDGFSFVTAEPSNEERAFASAGRTPLAPPQDGTRHRIHSLGGVVIGDDVEIGANSTVDAGTIRATQIGDGTKIDNLVQVGHNVLLGADCVLCAQAAVAGSARLGDRVVMGGKSGVKDNVSLGRDVVLGGGAIVLADVADGLFMMGYPAQPMPAFRAGQKALRMAVPKGRAND